MINDPWNCEVDVDTHDCGSGEEEDCLTLGQAETSGFIYGDDMVDDQGNVLAPARH